MSGIVVGTTGSAWRAEVTPWGAVVPADGGTVLDWWLGADDRWHVPADEPTVRQRRIDGTPVVETVVRVPGGDAVHRAYAVADAGGMLVVDVENQSPLPFAVAFGRRDLWSTRPPSSVPVQGITLPVEASVFPVAHRTTLRVALPFRASGPGVLPADLPTFMQVVRGWQAHCDRTGRVVLPDRPLADQLTAARCAAVLEPLPAIDDDPVAFLLVLAERVRGAQGAASWVEDVAGSAERVAVARRRGGAGWDDLAALEAAAVVLRRVGEQRAFTDVDAVIRRLAPDPELPASSPPGPRLLAWVARRLLAATEGGADLLPGFAPEWAGQGLEVYGADARDITVGFAVRWHGERPAVLWECSAPLRLTASALDPTWAVNGRACGEALLAPYDPYLQPRQRG